MTLVNSMMEAATRAAIVAASGGAQVTFQRVTGLAPNAVLVSATVIALVRDFLPDRIAAAQQGYSPSQLGGITGVDREIVVMATDLAAAGFPLPLKVGDNALVADSGEKLKIARVDMAKRAIAGCIEARGVTS